MLDELLSTVSPVLYNHFPASYDYVAQAPSPVSDQILSPEGGPETIHAAFGP